MHRSGSWGCSKRRSEAGKVIGSLCSLVILHGHHDGLYMVTVTHRKSSKSPNPKTASSFTIPAAVSAGSRSVPVLAGSQPDRLCARWRWADTRSRATSSWNDPLRGRCGCRSLARHHGSGGVGDLGGPGKLSPKPKYHWESPQEKPGTTAGLVEMFWVKEVDRVPKR